MTKRLTKIQFVVAVVVIALCLAVALALPEREPALQEPAFAASESQHHVYFGSDTHGSGHAGTKLDQNLLNQHVRDDGNYGLPAGKYYLSGNLELKAILYLTDNDSAICLNGYQLTATKGSAICVDDGYTSDSEAHPKHHYFRLFDCHDSSCTDTNHTHTVTGQNDNAQHTIAGGVITGGKVGGVDVESGNFYMYSGTIAGNTGYYEGGGIRMVCGELRLYGGTICYNKSGWYGGGVMVGEEASLLLSGGHIRENVVTPVSGEDHKYSKGGGVYVSQKTSMTFCSGEVTANSATEGGGIYVADSSDAQNAGNNAKLNIYGSPVVKDNNKDGDKRNIRLGNGNKIHVTGSFASDAHVEISADKSVNDIDGFDPSKQTVSIKNIFIDESGNGAIARFKDGALDWITKHSHNDITFEILDNDIIKKYSNNIPAGNYFLTENISLTAPLQFADGCTLCLAGYQIKLESGTTCVINAGANFGLYDCQWGVRDEDFNHSYPSAIDGASKGLYGGLITGGKASGVVATNNFNMYGGVIAGNSGENGGGVLVHSGDFNMHGGIVCFNLASGDGGGVYVNRGNVTMDSKASDQSEIRDNKAEKNGGGLYVENAQYFNMNGGKIGRGKDGSGNDIDDGNTAAGGEGGGAYVNFGTVTITGGEISKNDASGDGGGLYVVQDGHINGGEISGNTSGGKGGGAYLGYNGSSAKGCTVSDNDAGGPGGGIYFSGDGTVDNPNITRNDSYSCGGGIYAGGNMTISGGSITHNDAYMQNGDGNGGGVYFSKTGSIDGTKIEDNSSRSSYGDGNGGGVYAADNVKLTNVTLTSNSAGKGGGAYFENQTEGSIEQSTIDSNSVSNYGGGIYIFNSISFTVNEIEMHDNHVSNGAQMVVNNSTVMLEGKGIDLSQNKDANFKVITLTQDALLDIASGDALLALANANMKFSFSGDCLIQILPMDASKVGEPTAKVRVGYEHKDMTGTLVEKQANSGDLDVSKYFVYDGFEDETLCCAVSEKKIETAKTHSLVCEGDPSFDDGSLETTYKLKCDRCGEQNITLVMSASNTRPLAASCTKKAETIYDFNLDTDSFRANASSAQPKIENPQLYEMKQDYQNSFGVETGGNPAGHSWTFSVEGKTIIAKCSNPIHDESRDGCASEIHMDVDAPLAREGKDKIFYDGAVFELNVTDDSHFAEHDAKLTTKFFYGTAKGNETQPVDEAKKAGFYVAKIYVGESVDPEASAILEIPFEIAKAELTFELVKASGVYNAKDFSDIDVTFAELAKGESLVKGVDYKLKFGGTDTLPKNAGDYEVTVELESTDLTANYVVKADFSKTFTVAKAKIATNKDFDSYKHGVDEVYDPDQPKVKLSFPDYGADGFPFDIVGENAATVQYIVATFDLTDGSSSDEIAKYLAELQKGEHAADWKAYSDDMALQDPAAYCVYFKVEAENNETYYGYYMLHIYHALYTITLSGNDLTLGNLQYGDTAISADALRQKIKDLTVSITAKSEDSPDLDQNNRMDELFGDNNFVFYLAKNGACYTGANYEIGTYFVQAKYVDSKGVESQFISFEWKVQNSDGDGKPTFDVGKRELTFELVKPNETYKSAPFDDVDVNFLELQNGETLKKGTDYNVKFDGKDDLPAKVASYKVTLEMLDTDVTSNYTFKELTLTFSVNGAEVAMVLPTDDVYNGNSFDLLPYIQGQGNEVLYKGTDYNVKYDGAVALPKNAGSYQVSIELVSNELTSNYVAGDAKTYTIAKAPVKRPSATNAKFTYDAEKKSMYVMDYDSALMSETVDEGSVFVASTGEFFATNAAVHTLRITVRDSVNYKWETGSEGAIEFTLTIDKAQLTFDVPEGDDFDPNGRNILPTIAGEGKDVLVRGRDYNVKYGDAYALPVNVGDYQVTIELLDTDLADNYTADGQTKTYTISKKRLDKPTITDAGLVYNGQNQYASVSGFDYDTMTADSESFAGDRLNAVVAGTHSVTIALDDKNNYEWTDGGTDDVTLSFAIAKAPLTFTVGGPAPVYDGTEKTAEIDLAGLQGSDELAMGEDYAVKYNGADALPIGAGDYTVTIELLDTEYTNNYTFNGHSQTFTVAKATIAKLKSQQITSKMYGKTKTFDIEGYDAALYVLSGKSIKDGKFSVNRDGNHSVTVAIKDKANYAWDDGSSEDLTITVKIVDPRPIGFEETVAMSTVIPAGSIAIAAAGLAIGLKKRKKRKSAKSGKGSDDKADGSADKGDAESSKDASSVGDEADTPHDEVSSEAPASDPAKAPDGTPDGNPEEATNDEE